MLRLRSLALQLALVSLAGLAAAQEPKPGSSWYEDMVQLGFRVKAPKDWGFTPGNPLDPNTIGKWAPNNGEGVGLGGDAGVFINVYRVRFDNRDNPPKGVARDIRSWVSQGMEAGQEKGHGWSLAAGYPRELKGTKIPSAQCYVFEGLSTESIRAYAGAQVSGFEKKPIQSYAVFPLAADLDVALVGVGPGEKKWRSYEKAFETLAKSLEPLALESASKDAVGADPRSQKRAKLQAEMARTPGWRMLESANYFIVSNCTDEPFLSEVQERIEAIRKVYQVDYPPEKACLVRASTAAAEAPAEEPADGVPAEERTVAIPVVNPLEASRSSVVRVCSNQEQYIQYGGSPSAPGYWNSAAEELVLFDDQKGGGRADTWVVLNHEAFHQYIYYFYGSISPHSWYKEGTGDFYSGYMYAHRKFTLQENPWRIRGIQESLRQGLAKPKSAQDVGTGYAPLSELVRWSQPLYYGSNPYRLSAPDCYAQGWSFIYFLRTGEKKKAKGWSPAWGQILDTYLATLADDGELDKAVDTAYAGIDWAALEESWKNYILSL
ncbi:MAG: hypothetical protein EXS08_00820 [Planctomycetes bacterium]|nr:hypothetical protein [Planctomycetota bacterium]